MRRLLALLALAPALAACLSPPDLGSADAGGLPDAPVVVPRTAWYDAPGEPLGTKSLGLRTAETGAQPFHAFEDVLDHVAEWNASRPDLVDVRTIGASWNGRPLLDVVVTNEAIPGPKPVALFDGAHHGNEIAGAELALYLVDFLLDNYATNATVRSWVDRLEIHTVPIVNPDGYVAQTRGNALGVNLNRNYDLDWGNPLGASNLVMGTLAHTTNRSMPSVAVVLENSGPTPFSEPESVAMRDLLASFGDRLVVYLTYHTPTNALAGPWSAYAPPFPLPAEHDAVIEEIFRWTRASTEYRAGKAQWGNFSAGLPYAASGSSQDYAYANWQAPAFTLEVEIWYTSITSEGYVERAYLQPYNGLRYWMEASLPIPLYLLANWEELADWRLPTREPPLPAGVPPALPTSYDGLTKGAEPEDEDPSAWMPWVPER